MSGESVAVIGGGVSGVGAADTLRRLGFRPVIFERGNRAGGQWTSAYLGARLQNTWWGGYEFVSFSWKAAGIVPDRHPTREQVLKYVEAAAIHFDLDMRLNTEVTRMEESKDAKRPGWRLFTHHRTNRQDAASDLQVDYQVPRNYHDGEERYRGKVVTALNLNPSAEFSAATKNGVVVVGMGKTALDLTVFAAREGAPCTLVFRKARWLIPDYVFSLVTYSLLLFSRAGGSIMVPCWAQPDSVQRFVHATLSGIVSGFWTLLSAVITLSHVLDARKGMPPKKKISAVASARARLNLLWPQHKLVYDFRSAIALAPTSFFSNVARGAITPHCGTICRLSEDGVILDDGTHVNCDIVALGTGSSAAAAPYLPKEYARIFQGERGGLYRHVIHPDIPRVAWAGMNHGFAHTCAVEIGVLWTTAACRREIDLPAAKEMRASIDRVRLWKSEHCASEPCMPSNVNARYQAYADTLARELGIPAYRKLPNVFAELCAPYTPADYASVVSEYNAAKARRAGRSLPSLPIAM